jgi:hypothetical protein
MTLSRWILLTMRNVSNKSCRENYNTHFVFRKFFPENRAIYEIISKNLVEPERPQMAIQQRVACWISKATRAQAHASARSSARAHTHTHTHTPTRKHKNALAVARAHTLKYVIFIAFLQQQWFRESALILRYIYIYIYIACLVFIIIPVFLNNCYILTCNVLCSFSYRMTKALTASRHLPSLRVSTYGSAVWSITLSSG